MLKRLDVSHRVGQVRLEGVSISECFICRAGDLIRLNVSCGPSESRMCAPYIHYQVNGRTLWSSKPFTVPPHVCVCVCMWCKLGKWIRTSEKRGYFDCVRTDGALNLIAMFSLHGNTSS